MRYFTFKGICVLDNEGRQLSYNKKIIVGSNHYIGYYFDFHESRVNMTRGNIKNPTHIEVVGDICDLAEITKREAIELLKRKEKLTIVAYKANRELFDNENMMARTKDGHRTRYINDEIPRVAPFVNDIYS